MLLLPDRFESVIVAFTSLFSKRVFQHVKLMLAAAILTPGKRTISSLLRIVGLSQEKSFHKYHRLLSRARWSALAASRLLLTQLLACFLPQGPVVVGLDETLERRWGKKIAQRGIYRDSVRSSRSHFVKTSGLRWVCLLVLLPITWAKRVWALPFLTVLAPSERYAKQRGRRHKKLPDWARQMLWQLKRWLPERAVIAVADSSYAVIDLLAALPTGASMITRLRLDAALYEPAPARQLGKPGRTRKKGQRLPTLAQVARQPDTFWQPITFSEWYGQQDKPMQVATATAVWYHSGKPTVAIRWVLLRDPEDKLPLMALLSTDVDLSARQIVAYFVRRWSIEVTFAEMRTHLGMETQKQWSEKAIARSTPALLGLFSLVTLLADKLEQAQKLPVSSSAWYKKQTPTFSDAMAGVRMYLWQESHFCTSDSDGDLLKIPKQQLMLWKQALAWAA